MAQFTKSLCEEVIRTEGRVGLTANEKVQMARLALRALEAGPKLVDQPLPYSTCESHHTTKEKS